MLIISKKKLTAIIKETMQKERKKIYDDEIIEEILQDHGFNTKISEAIDEEIRDQKKEFDDIWELRHGTQERAREEVYERIDYLVENSLKEEVSKQVKEIKDQLLVELARKAMNLDDKGGKK